MILLVVFVDRESTGSNQPSPVVRPAAVAEQNREAAILVGQDQAPHLAALPAHRSPIAGLRDAIAAYMRSQIAMGAIDGPLARVGCAALPGGPPGRLRFSCTAVAASVSYPFRGTVAPAAHRVTYCKRDLPPVPSMNIPLSPRCT